MGKRIKLGDIVEIHTRKGSSYCQCTHHVAKWGHLLRILPGFFEPRPSDICVVANQATVFVTFFPLQAAVNKKIFAVVGNCAVPVHASKFPLFRAPGWRDRSGHVLDWWLWDGVKSWKIGELSPEQRKLPIQEVINDTLLVERIERGWRPETDRD